jgi:hypothetical protein
VKGSLVEEKEQYEFYEGEINDVDADEEFEKSINNIRYGTRDLALKRVLRTFSMLSVLIIILCFKDCTKKSCRYYSLNIYSYNKSEMDICASFIQPLTTTLFKLGRKTNPHQ